MENIENKKEILLNEDTIRLGVGVLLLVGTGVSSYMLGRKKGIGIGLRGALTIGKLYGIIKDRDESKEE